MEMCHADKRRGFWALYERSMSGANTPNTRPNSRAAGFKKLGYFSHHNTTVLILFPHTIWHGPSAYGLIPQIQESIFTSDFQHLFFALLFFFTAVQKAHF